MADPRSRPLIALDLTRFACALLVLAFHFGAGFALLPPPGAAALLAGQPVDARLVPFVNSGWIGVDVFFVISGFVIAWSAEGSDAPAFLGRRALRLAPVAWLCASVTAAALLAFSALDRSAVIAQWLGALTFWPTIRPIDPSYWTLAIEVSFYLLVTLALIGGSTLHRIERVGAFLGCASFAYWLAHCFLTVPPASNRLMHLTLLPHGCFFALGVLIRAGQRLGWNPLRLTALAPAGVAALIEIDAHRMETYGDGLAHVPPELWFALGLLPILFAERLQPWLEQRVRASAATTMGLMTYPLYLLHQELSAMLIGSILHAGGSYWPAAAVAFATMLALSWLVVRFFEPPVRRTLMRLARRASVRAVPLGEVAV